MKHFLLVLTILLIGITPATAKSPSRITRGQFLCSGFVLQKYLYGGCTKWGLGALVDDRFYLKGSLHRKN